MHYLSMACDRWRLYVERVYNFVIEKKKQKSETTSKNQLNIPICPYKRDKKKKKKKGGGEK